MAKYLFKGEHDARIPLYRAWSCPVERGMQFFGSLNCSRSYGSSSRRGVLPQSRPGSYESSPGGVGPLR